MGLQDQAEHIELLSTSLSFVLEKHQETILLAKYTQEYLLSDQYKGKMYDISLQLSIFSPWVPQGKLSFITKVVVGVGAKLKAAAICCDGAGSTEKKPA